MTCVGDVSKSRGIMHNVCIFYVGKMSWSPNSYTGMLFAVIVLFIRLI